MRAVNGQKVKSPKDRNTQRAGSTKERTAREETNIAGDKGENGERGDTTRKCFSRCFAMLLSAT
jgi:heme-binding NEAT domain protein